MKEPTVLLTMKDLKRHEIIKEVLAKKLSGIQASKVLGITPVHFSRLKKKVQLKGIQGLLRSGREAPNKKVDIFSSKVISLRKKLYYDFNISHFNEKLSEVHKINLSYETVRKILIAQGLHISKKKKIIHRQRRRMPKVGLLVQMDSSQHKWLAHIKTKWWLIAIIDDASSEVLYARFFTADNLFNNMHVIRRCIEKKGLFMSLYADKASHFKTTRHAGIHYNIQQEYDDTQIERALEEIGITLIPANSPQAKGRIERLFRTFQDRLIAEMRLAGIKNYEQANKFLSTFIPDHNRRFSIKNIPSVYRQLPKNINLDIIFCKKEERTVKSDNTIQLNKQIIQIPPSANYRSFAKRKVIACTLEDNRIYILYKNNIIANSILSKNNKSLKKQKMIEKTLNLSEYFDVPKKKHIPSKDHPWRKWNPNYL